MTPRKSKTPAVHRITSLKPQPPARTGAKSNGAIALTLAAPAAQHVAIAGSFNDWKPTPLTRKPIKGGEWASELKLAPGCYEYLFVVDGQWLPDPAAKHAVPNPFGGVNSVLSVG